MNAGQDGAARREPHRTPGRGRAGARLAACAAAALLAAAGACAQPGAPAKTRGALLYETHCIACHDTQVHWRDRKLATDWNTLKAQVRAWQATDRLGWSETDIVEVARHLNVLHYRFPPQVARSVSAPRRPPS